MVCCFGGKFSSASERLQFKFSLESVLCSSVYTATDSKTFAMSVSYGLSATAYAWFWHAAL
jgi:hypothetical protein